MTLGLTSGLTSGFGVVPSGFNASSYFHPPHLKVDPGFGADDGATGADVAVGAVTVDAVAVGAGAGAEVLLNRLDAFEVYSLTFSLNGNLLIYSLALLPIFLNIEGFGALVVLGALAIFAVLCLPAL